MQCRNLHTKKKHFRTQKHAPRQSKFWYHGGMMNRVLNIEPTNQSLPAEWRGIRYEFMNGWSLSVHLTKRYSTHECALLNPEGQCTYIDPKEDDQNLMFLTSQQVARLVDYIQQEPGDTLQRVRQWLLFERNTEDEMIEKQRSAYEQAQADMAELRGPRGWV